MVCALPREALFLQFFRADFPGRGCRGAGVRLPGSRATYRAGGTPAPQSRRKAKKVAKYLEWDRRQLRHIAEIARRVPLEGVAAVAKDFWRRGIKDRRGRPWGEPRPKPFSLFCTPYQGFYRAVRWFHRMKWKGLLLAPYDGLAASMPEPKTFRAEPSPRGGPVAARRGASKSGRNRKHPENCRKCLTGGTPGSTIGFYLHIYPARHALVSFSRRGAPKDEPGFCRH